MDGGTGMGTSCQRWTIFSAGGRCFAALSKIWCQQAWYILVELLLEPHYRENLEWNFTFTFLFSRMLICLPGMTVSAKRRLPMYTVPLSAPFETLAINTWSAKWVCPKLGTDIYYIYINTSHQMTIVKIRENDHETRSAYLHRSFLLYYNNFQIQGTPEVGCI